MRPDKQKAKYKKRAGYAPGAVDKKSLDAGKKETKSKTEKESQNLTAKTAITPRTEKPASESEESSGEEGVRTRPAAQFRRRHIESNWTRYAELPSEVDDVAEQEFKTLEFQRLLTAKVVSEAHLVLEDERDWQAAVLGPDDVTDTSGYLSIDCEALAAAVRCVPLHERLGVEEITQQAGLIEEFISRATDINGVEQVRTKPQDGFHFTNPSYSKVRAETEALADSLSKTLNVIHPFESAQPAPSGTNNAANDRPQFAESTEALSRVTDTKQYREDNENWTSNECTEVTFDWIGDTTAEDATKLPVQLAVNLGNLHTTLSNWDNGVDSRDTGEGNRDNGADNTARVTSATNVYKTDDDDLDFLLSLDVKAPQHTAPQHTAPQHTAPQHTAVLQPTPSQTSEARSEGNLEEWLDSIL